MSTENTEGYIQCEKFALLDLSIRGYKKVDRLPISEMINVSDAIQGIFWIYLMVLHRKIWIYHMQETELWLTLKNRILGLKKGTYPT